MSKAMEAAARAIARRNYPGATDLDADDMAESFALDAQAAVTAYLAAREAEGWKLTPTEPTEAMVLAALHMETKQLGDVPPIVYAKALIRDTYRAMLAARPTEG